ncbi:hypothetical protein O7599_05505 [Streptomyces sp. WMMC500]|uniref:hypothetical protein n=1 Tax=Streptomyces sp. WMMC500 TaxID=3015154 RepID=UPI00248BDA37|nr:hypothetical protein [Streptomyces sp. WMMC500]WBB61997.1 hypothetical protein O7599_05505 [Streptomyces sp. WMMC500]
MVLLFPDFFAVAFAAFLAAALGVDDAEAPDEWDVRPLPPGGPDFVALMARRFPFHTSPIN